MEENKNIEFQEKEQIEEQKNERFSIKKRFMEATAKWSKSQKLTLVYMLIMVFFALLVFNTWRLYNSFFN